MATLNPFTQTRRLIIKIGSALLVDPESGQLRTEWLESLCADIAALHKSPLNQSSGDQSGVHVVIVSSGAIALGRQRLGLQNRRLSLPEKQACAAAGQSRLTQAYERCLADFGIITAQALLTLTDTENRQRWLNARATLETLLSIGSLPIVNENDTVATDEIRYGDNDRLAARAAQMLGADTLILLSDIDGLYTGDPRQNPDSTHIPVIDTLTPDIMAMAGQANQQAQMGSGGMVTKLLAAQIATDAGCHMCIMDGTEAHPLTRLQSGARASWFKAKASPLSARRQWIRGALKPRGQLTIDAGAMSALQNGKSLLAAGVVEATGAFKKGDAVTVCDSAGRELARGLIAYGAAETAQILGLKSSDIANVLGYDNGDSLIHRDNLALLI